MLKTFFFYPAVGFKEPFLTSCDVLMTKYDLLCYPAAHADVHLGEQLRAGLTPTIIIWEHGHLRKDGRQD